MTEIIVYTKPKTTLIYKQQQNTLYPKKVLDFVKTISWSFWLYI